MQNHLFLVLLAVIGTLSSAQQTVEEELVIKDPELIQELLKAATVENPSERDIPLPPVEVLATTPPPPLSTTEAEPVPLRQRFRLRNLNRPAFLPRTRPSILSSSTEDETAKEEDDGQEKESSGLFTPKRLRTRFQPRARPSVFTSRSRAESKTETETATESESASASGPESDVSEESEESATERKPITIDIVPDDDEEPEESNEISDDNEGDAKTSDEATSATPRSLFAPRRRFRPRPRIASTESPSTRSTVDPTDALPTDEAKSTDESPTSPPQAPSARPLFNNRRTSPFLRRPRPTSNVLGFRSRGSRVTTTAATTTTVASVSSTTPTTSSSVFVTSSSEATTSEPEIEEATEYVPEVMTTEASIFVTVETETESPEAVTPPPAPTQPFRPVFGRRRLPETPRRRVQPQPQQVASEPTTPRRRVVSRRRNPNAGRQRLQPETPVRATAEPAAPETTTNQRVLPPTARQIIRIQPDATEPQPTADTTTTTASQTIVPSTARQVIEIEPESIEPQPTEELPSTTTSQPQPSSPPQRRFQTAPRRTSGRTNPRRLPGTGLRRIPKPEPEVTSEEDNTILTGTAPRRRIDFTSGRTEFTSGRTEVTGSRAQFTNPDSDFVDIPKIKQVNEFIPRQIKVTPQVVAEDDEEVEVVEVEAPRSTQPSRPQPFVPLFTLQAEPTESLRQTPLSDPTKPTNSGSSPAPSRQTSRFQPLTFPNSIVFTENKLPNEITIPNVRPGVQQRFQDPAQIARDILRDSIVVPLVKIDPPTTLSSQQPSQPSQPAQPTQSTPFVTTTFRQEPQDVTKVVPTNSFLENTVRSNALPNKFQVTKPAQSSGERVTVEDRYRHQNPDGSITWGYKSTDGSFKEETIGADCVTRGRYGYIDPQGKIREFSYQNGIPCNPETREVFNRRSSKSTTSKVKKVGYYDYNTNKFVLPDGRRVTLEVNDKFRARG